MKLSKFIDVSPPDSLVSRKESTNIVDNTKPLTFDEWMRYTSRVGGTPEKIQSEYKEYLSGWSSSRVTEDQNISYRQQYITYLKQLTYSYIFTQDEKRIVNTVDYDNPYEVDTVSHIWAKRIKQLCEYIKNQREELKFQPTKVQQRCTTGGIENIIQNSVLRLLEDEDIREEFVNDLDQLDRVKNELRVEITELYDLEEGYYNNNKFEVEFNDTDRGKLAQVYNTLNFDPYIFLDEDQALNNIVQSYNISTNISIESDQVIQVPLSQDYVTIEDLPPNEFIDYTNSLTTLTTNTVKSLIQSSIGVDLHYAKTDSESNIESQGILVQATNKAGNILNRRNPTVNIVSNDQTMVYNLQQIGGFFTPDKQGILTYASLEPTFQIKTDQLTPDTLYVYNDPEVYSSNNEEYKSTEHPPLPLEFIENVRWMKSDKSHDGNAGDIAFTTTLPKFYNYSSEAEINTHSKYGISRFDDTFDFWSGSKSDIWANSDIFAVSEIKNIPIESRQESLLVNSGQIYKWRCDVYGNEYAMYKPLTNLVTTNDQILPECQKDKYLNELICEVIDGAPIKDILTGLPVYEQCVDGGTDQPTVDISENITDLQKAEQKFNKVFTCNGDICKPGSRWSSTGVLDGAVETGFSPQCAFTDFKNGSYFLPDICDESVLETSTLPLCRIIDGYSVEVPRRYNELDYYELSGTWHDSFEGQSGDFFEVPYDDLWDAGHFDTKCTINFDEVYKQNYSTKYIDDDFLYGTTTSVDSELESSNTKTIHQSNNITGRLIIRDASSRYVDDSSSVLKEFMSIIPDVSNNDNVDLNPRDQLSNQLIDFDIIHDVIVLYSKNFIYANKIQYNYDTGSIDPDYSAGLLISYDHNTTIPVKHFYNEKTQEIIVGCMSYSDRSTTGDIYSFFFPDKMYRISTQTNVLIPRKLNFSREQYILQGTILSVDLNDVAYITYNDQLNHYYITCGGVLQDLEFGDQFYIYQTRFTLDKDIPTAVTSQRPRLYYSSAIDSTVDENANESNNNTLQIDDAGLNYFDLSTYLNDNFKQTGFDYDTVNLENDIKNDNWINNRLLKPSTDDHNLSFNPVIPTFTPLFAPDKVQTFYFKLNIDAMFTLVNTQDTVYKIEARFARPDISPDHIDIVVQTRSPLPDWSKLDMTRLANKDDLTDPRQYILEYEYNFQTSPEQCPESKSLDSCISVTDWDNINSPNTPSREVGDLYKFVIILHTMDGKKHYYPYKFILKPYTAGTCLGDIKINNVTSYVDNDYHECSLIILESQSPKFVMPVVLRTEALEKVTFNSSGAETKKYSRISSPVYINQETVTNIYNNN